MSTEERGGEGRGAPGRNSGGPTSSLSMTTAMMRDAKAGPQAAGGGSPQGVDHGKRRPGPGGGGWGVRVAVWGTPTARGSGGGAVAAASPWACDMPPPGCQPAPSLRSRKTLTTPPPPPLKESMRTCQLGQGQLPLGGTISLKRCGIPLPSPLPIAPRLRPKMGRKSRLWRG